MHQRFAQLRHTDTGLAVAEYAVATIAVCAFAAVLYKILTSGMAEQLLVSVIRRALEVLY